MRRVLKAEFSEAMVWTAWSKGEILGGNDPVLWRKDACGAWMLRSHYMRTDSDYGWIIDHIVPPSDGGTDDLSNLRPMHWTLLPPGTAERIPLFQAAGRGDGRLWAERRDSGLPWRPKPPERD